MYYFAVVPGKTETRIAISPRFYVDGYFRALTSELWQVLGVFFFFPGENISAQFVSRELLIGESEATDRLNYLTAAGHLTNLYGSVFELRVLHVTPKVETAVFLRRLGVSERAIESVLLRYSEAHIRHALEGITTLQSVRNVDAYIRAIIDNAHPPPGNRDNSPLTEPV